MTTLPSDVDLADLARQVDEQLNALQFEPADSVQFRGKAAAERGALPAAPKQQAVIEKAAGRAV